MKILISFIYILLFTGYLCANPRVLMKHYTAENGLPNNDVSCIIKDKDNFFWFGTWYGLCRFDGYTYKKYIETEQPLLDMAPRKIDMLQEDCHGILWIKTIDGKLYTFDKRTEVFSFLNDEIKDMAGYAKVIKIQKSKNGDMLILTKDKNLFEASSYANGQFDIKLICEVDHTKLDHNWQLKENILSESDTHICWIGKDYKIIAIKKPHTGTETDGKHILGELLADGVNNFTSACEDNGFLWIGDDRGNIISIDTSTGIANRFILPQVKQEVESLYMYKKRLYFSVKDTGVFMYDISSKEIKKCFTVPRGEKVVSVIADTSNMLWFNTTGALFVCNPVDRSVNTYSWNSNQVLGDMKVTNWDKQYKFVLTPDGEAWMIDVLNDKKYFIHEVEGTDATLKKQVFTDIHIDSENGVWMTTATAGVYSIHFRGTSFELIKEMPFVKDTVNNDFGGVRALCQTKNGNIWIGTRKKALHIINSEGQLLHSFYGKDHDWLGHIYHIMEDSRGNIWLSSKGNGLIKATADKQKKGEYVFHRCYHLEEQPYSISSDDVYFTYEDTKGRIWVGTFGGGLNLCDDSGKVPVFYNIYNNIGNYPDSGLYREVRTIAEDSNGRIWIGTRDGLMSIDGDFKTVQYIDFEIYRSNSNSGITENDVYVLYKDDSSKIWGSVFGGGLLSLDHYDEDKHQPQFVLYGEKEGVNNNVIFGITEDANGNVWFSTERGLLSYNKKTKKFSNFDSFDGFPDVEIEENVMIHTQQNEIWMGTKQGMLKFDPKKTYSHKLTSPTYIVDFKVLNKSLKSGVDIPVSVPYMDKFTLEHNQSMFTIEFAALNYVGRFRVSYRYKLQGYEDDWHFTGDNRIASYTNVPPGKYTFIVEAIDHTDSSFISSRKIIIEVLPPWWVTWWAYCIYFLVGLLLLYISIRFALSFVRMRNNVYIEQKLAELKIKFFTNVSHELRTPLTLISGPIQELKQKEALSEKGMQYVEMMERSIQQMLQLVNQILDFRKIQNGKMKLHISVVDLSKFLSSVCEEFKVFSMENNISFTVHPIDKSVKLWIDEEKFGIVIRNILSNAFKYTPKGGEVVVDAKIDNGTNSCRISIADSGVGISAEKIEEIFERFSQDNNNSNIPYKGTGIGLALSKELVNMHHGTIVAESDGKKGATFIVEIPLGKNHFKDYEVDFYVGDLPEVKDGVKGSVEMPVPTDDENPDASKPTILLVEDNADLCMMLKMQLEEEFNVFVASDGLEGLEKIEKVHPDLVITDQMMPKMDGLEMIQNIKKNFETSHIPVILLTALNGDDIKQKAYSIGVNSYISKPFSKDLLMIRIKQLLEERKHFIDQFYKPMENQEVISYEENNQLFEKKDVELLKNVRMIIEDNLDNPDFNIDSIAQQVGLSRSAFFKKLKSLLGLAPVDFIKEIRLNKAEQLIKTTELSISEIAYAVGFKDASYFSKCFRAKYNQSPRDFINQYRNN